MALINRVSRLFQADMHAVLDRIEEPDVLLRQAVREMEEELSNDERRLQLRLHEQRQLIARQAEIEHTLQEIEDELDLCFSSSKEHLARPLVKRKLETTQFKKALARKGEGLEQTLNDLGQRLEENRGQLESMRQKVELLAAENRPDPQPESWATPRISIREEDVELALLREKQKRSQP